jgi:hypothetical protein
VWFAAGGVISRRTLTFALELGPLEASLWREATQAPVVTAWSDLAHASGCVAAWLVLLAKWLPCSKPNPKFKSYLFKIVLNKPLTRAVHHASSILVPF